MTLDRLDTVMAFAAVMLGVSLIITVLTQAIGTLLGHRGTYLKESLVDLLGHLDPLLEPHADAIVTRVLTHDGASDSLLRKWVPKFTSHNGVVMWFLDRWKLATAIRPEELVQLLRVCTQGNATTQPLIDRILAEVNPELVRQADLLARTFNDAATIKASADQMLKQLSDKANEAAGKLEALFNSTVDRVSQRFAMQMRIWTIVLALLIAVVAHLDAFKLYSQLASDPTQRSALVGAADALLKKAADVLPAELSVPGIYKALMKQLQNQQPAVSALGEPPSFSSRGEAEAWLRNGLAGNNQAADIVKQYNQLLDEGLRSAGQKLADQYKELNQTLSSAGFQLWPSPYPGWLKRGEIVGVLVTAALLSLGAPFWFNALKTLSNLRPILASKAESE